MIHKVAPEVAGVIFGNAIAVLGTAIVWLSDIDTIARILVAGVDVVIGSVTIVWLRERHQKHKLETRKLELEISKLESDG